MFQKCSFCPTLQIRGLLERSHSSHPTTVRAVNERLIRHAQGSPSGSLSPRAIGLCRTFRNSTPLFITAVSTYKGITYCVRQHGRFAPSPLTGEGWDEGGAGNSDVSAADAASPHPSPLPQGERELHCAS